MHCTCILELHHPLINYGHLCRVHFVAITNRIAMIIDGEMAPVARRKFPWIQLDNVVDLFLDLGNLQTDILSDYTNLHSQVMWVSLSPYPH